MAVIVSNHSFLFVCLLQTVSLDMYINCDNTSFYLHIL